jgi:aryl-alcohol dehydrogenase-like predicted oxidoreductase
MKYRRLGKTGLKLSEISIGIWQNFQNEDALENGRKILETALENGVNYIDGAEGYGESIGASEELAGKILRSINPPRNSYAVSGKIIPSQFGHNRPIMAGGILSGKYLDGIKEGSRVDQLEWFRNANKQFPGKNEKIVKLKEFADKTGLSIPRAALALALKNPLISSLICDASSPEHIAESCMASDDSEKLSKKDTEESLAIFGIEPAAEQTDA